jgi:GDP-4-dehydro-6-deoxy-D-mannose reductase
MAAHRILVTGAAGFVGRHLFPALRERLPDAELHAATADVTDAQAVETEIVRIQPDRCVHLAAISAIRDAGRDPDRAWAVNLHGTLHVARAILSRVPRCALIFASSADAYGASFRTGHALDETAALAPMNTYSATKAAADLALGAMATEGLHAIRVRPFTHTGPGQMGDFVVTGFARQIARIVAGVQEPVLRVGALDTQRDFLDVRDICAGYATCVARAEELERGTIFNLASGTPRRIGDVLQALCTEAGVQPQVQTDLQRLRASDIKLTWGDASRARAQLGWAPRIPWEETLRALLADWQDRVRSEQSTT